MRAKVCSELHRAFLSCASRSSWLSERHKYDSHYGSHLGQVRRGLNAMVRFLRHTGDGLRPLPVDDSRNRQDRLKIQQHVATHCLPTLT